MRRLARDERRHRMGYIGESMQSSLFIGRINNIGGIIRGFRPIFNAQPIPFDAQIVKTTY